MIALVLGSCAPAPRYHAPQVKPTIVSLNPCTDAVLVEVADPGQLLALSSYSHDPASSSIDLALARRFPSTSGSVEEVMSLQPDLVVSGSYTPPATRAAFAGMGLRLEEFGIASTVAESETQVRQIAALAGHPDRGEVLVARIEAALAKASPPKENKPIPAVIWESGGIVAGDNTLIADLLRRTGFSNLAAARGMGQAQVLPLERMLADPPRVILAAGNAEAQEDRMLAHPVLAGLQGLRRARLAPALLWCGGPTIEKAARRLSEVRLSIAPPPVPPLERRGESIATNPLPILFRGGGRGVVASGQSAL